LNWRRPENRITENQISPKPKRIIFIDNHRKSKSGELTFNLVASNNTLEVIKFKSGWKIIYRHLYNLRVWFIFLSKKKKEKSTSFLFGSLSLLYLKNIWLLNLSWNWWPQRIWGKVGLLPQVQHGWVKAQNESGWHPCQSYPLEGEVDPLLCNSTWSVWLL
jgi:hypothetical protein